MQFKPIQVPTATDLFVQQLKAAIFTGKFLPGDRLPSERELAEQMQVSRQVISNGLKKLQSLHLIEIRPRDGAFVANYREDGDLETLNTIINFHGGHYRLSFLKSLFRLRTQMEGDIVGLAAIHHETPDLKTAEQALKAFKAAGNSQKQAEQIFLFIHALAVASKNEVYPLLINNFKSLYLTLGKWTCEDLNLDEIQSRNMKLLQAIKNHDESTAVALDHEIINWSYAALTAHL